MPHRPLVAVAQWKERKIDVAAVHRYNLISPLDIGHNIVVGQHDPFRGAGGSAGVNQSKEIVRFRQPGPVFEIEVRRRFVALAQLKQFAEGDHILPVVTIIIHHNNSLDELTFIEERQNFVGLFPVLRNDNLRFRIIEDEFNLGGGERGIDGSCGAAHANDSVI